MSAGKGTASANGSAPEKAPFVYEATTDDQRQQLERGLLTRRLAEYEAEHAATSFGLRQLEKQIEQARAELADLSVEEASEK